MGIYTSNLGRVGAIMDKVYTLFNDLKTGARFISEQDLLLWINDCQEDIAQDGYWHNVATVGVTVNVDTYRLTDLGITENIVHVHNIRLVDGNKEISVISNWATWADIVKQSSLSSSTDWPYVMIHNDTLRIYPTPTATNTDYMKVYYSYCPPQLGGGIEITLDAAAAYNATGGKVRLSTTSSDLQEGDVVNISGTTSYNGQYTALANTGADYLYITATYVVETLGTGARCGRYYTPEIPSARDDVFVNFCLMQACLKDIGRRAQLFKLYQSQYEASKRKLLGSARQLRRWIAPVR